MLSIEQISDIVALYRKYGWELRRILLTPETGKKLQKEINIKFPDAAFESAQIDAAWFSRPSADEREAWELRQLSETPYALFEAFDADDEEEVRDEIRKELEARMAGQTPPRL